jgi:hypothetical protein
MYPTVGFIDLLIRQPRKQKQKAEPNMRALARRFEALNSLTPSSDHSSGFLSAFECQSNLVQATLEKPGSCCFNPLQKDESTLTQACLWLYDSIGFKWKKDEEMVCFSYL